MVECLCAIVFLSTLGMSFHLIRFANGDIAVVPDEWCDDGIVYWPKYKNTERAKGQLGDTPNPVAFCVPQVYVKDLNTK